MEFTVDWHSHHAATWHRFLDSFTGQPVRCLEIGSHEGRSAVWMIRHLLSHPEASLTCVDPWPNPQAEKRFDANIDETGRANQVQKYKAESFKVLPLMQPGFDFIYVDGHHEGRHVLEDAIHSFRLLAIDGILIFDDYRGRPGAVIHPTRPSRRRVPAALVRLSGSSSSRQSGHRSQTEGLPTTSSMPARPGCELTIPTLT